MNTIRMKFIGRATLIDGRQITVAKEPINVEVQMTDTEYRKLMNYHKNADYYNITDLVEYCEVHRKG